MFGATAGVATVTAEEGGSPNQKGGTLRADWSGGVAHSTSAIWANAAPLLEANTTNPNAQIHPVYPGAFIPDRYETLHAISTVLPIVSEGGDVDNRGGTSALAGEPTVIRIPGGLSGFAGFAMNVYSPKMAYQPGLAISGGTVTVTPQVLPGGYFLRSTGEGYSRDWAAMSYVSVQLSERPRSEDLSDLGFSGTALVPAGLRGSAQLFDSTGVVRSLSLGSGMWRLTVAGGELTAERVAATG